MVAEPNMSNNFKNPPKLDQHDNYENWEKALKLWRLATDVPKAKQGTAVVLALTGKARDKVLELEIEQINGEAGIDLILLELAKIYKKDTIDAAYEAFEKFIKFNRDPSMNITEYINEFEKRYNKAKSHGFTLAASCLGYFLLNQARLSDDHKKLVRATITKLDLDEVKTKLKKVFGFNETAESVEGVRVKIEDVNLAEEDVLYGNMNRGYRSDNSYRYNRGAANFPRRFPPQGFHNSNAFGSSSNTSFKKKSYGQPGERKKLRCNICESTFHLSYNCPEKKVYAAEEGECSEEDYTVVLYQSNLITEDDYKTFVVESSTSAILDSGASANVAGLVWFESYLAGLSNEKLDKVKYFDSNSSFKFGSGKIYKSLFRAEIPACIGRETVLISTDVVETTVPLLISKSAMKKAETSINFVNDEVIMFGRTQKVHITESGHYAIPLNHAGEIIKKIDSGDKVKINLIAQSQINKHQMARKLHAQFGHPTKKKLLKVVKRAGMEADKELLKGIEEVTDACKICKEFTKPSPTPVVGMPHAEHFNETVALDLKFFNGQIILHAIDHLTRYSAAVVCKSKEPKTIIKAIIKCWISIFGPPKKFMVDNGGEFANASFIELAEAMNVRIVTTAAYSPWSNGLVERHNATLAEILQKVKEEDNYNDIETALCWALQAKNSLDNVHGFSPAQLVFGQNPSVPTTLNSSPPALESEYSTDIVIENLGKLKAAREAFIRAESAERVKRALRHNIRPSSNNRFFTGDLVFYKRNDSRRWKGPGRVIGSESSNILIKHGSTYVRVHACRVMLDRRADRVSEPNQESNMETERCDVVSTSKHEEDENNTTTNESSSDESSEEYEDAPEEQNAEGQEKAEEDEKTEGEEEEEEADDGLTQQAQNLIHMQKDKVKPGIVIDYMKNGEDWEVGQVISRAGKVGKQQKGKYGNLWNVKNLITGKTEQFEMRKNGKDWKIHEEADDEPNLGMINTHEVLMVSDEMKNLKLERVKSAKIAEIEKWKEENVYEEVPDEGQERMSTTWVITEKVRNEEVVTKARLVARGYEENKENIRSDSPTCMKNTVRMMLGIAAGKEWTIRSLDVKAAFLQGKSIDRDLYLSPPAEFRDKGKLWRLKKVVYGLCDASRSWYMKVVEVLTDLGMTVGKLEQAMFMFKTKSLEGLIIVHVDDMLYAGTKLFQDTVMAAFKRTLKVSRDDSVAFKYLGVRLTQGNNGIELCQTDYVRGMKQDLLPSEAMKNKDRFAEEEEISIFRQGVGQLGWVSSVSKPEASFGYCSLSVIQAKPQVRDFALYKKIVKELQSREWKIMIGAVNLDNVRITAFCDASFANLTDGASQIGYIVFMNDDQGNCAPLTWVSKKAKRVARSTLAAETLGAAEAADHAIFMKKILEETLDANLPPVTLLVDNKSLYDSVRNTSLLSEKRLLVEMASLREMQEKRQIIVEWVSTRQQLADGLTKAGANRQKLIDVLCQGKIDLDKIRSG